MSPKIRGRRTKQRSKGIFACASGGDAVRTCDRNQREFVVTNIGGPVPLGGYQPMWVDTGNGNAINVGAMADFNLDGYDDFAFSDASAPYQSRRASTSHAERTVSGFLS